MKKWFLLVMLAFAVSSSSVLLVPFAVGEDGSLNTVGYVSGILFWGGLLAGIGGYILINKKTDFQRTEDMEEKNVPDILKFFSNPPAKIMDVILIIGIMGTIYCAANTAVSEIIATIFLLFLLVGIYSHILLNGKIYQSIWENTRMNNRTDETKGGM